ncbi:halomucin [Biomphalaria glabrata]|uniref:Uncharacterized protein LOC106079368 n=2 Tax=Biomphalaria glabrata TaxID=6526 RepID=A0A9W2ZAZ0_BIOGL|nr:uncharacterized protein LOC106079368 [Biomphalaria glabrata]KAI8732677.1 nucleolar protein dao-5 isoform X4 [Biomphalaria glabrata]
MADTETTSATDHQQMDAKEEQEVGGKESTRKDKEKTTQPDLKNKTNANKTKKTKEDNNETNKMDPSEDGRSKQKEYFKTELNRLEDSLKNEYSKIQPPPKKPYTPYLFNSLEPYYNTHTVHYLIHMPDEKIQGFSSRSTAQTLIDPWVDLRMSTELPPIISPRQATLNAETSKKEGRAKKPPNREETAATRFPVIRMDLKELETKPLYYSDVPTLREHLKTKYSANAQAKIKEDYTRTQQEFYRMELDRLDQVHPVNRKHMTGVYFAYLQNTPGSKKAVTECVGKLTAAD